MGGGLMQLVAYGAQDIYLTGNPQITFFKVVYRRHTNFSMESIQQTWNGSPEGTAGSRCTTTISRNGDLVHKMYIQIDDIKGTQVNNNAGADWIQSATLEIGGQQIDKITGQWMEVWAELNQNNPFGSTGSLFQGMSMSGGWAKTDVTTNCSNVHVPLPFWFCRNVGNSLPLIALQYHEVKVTLEHGLSTVFTAAGAGIKQNLWVDYIYLDTDERRRFAQVSHEYLIEQLQYQQITNTTQRLNFNHPVKELIWCNANAPNGTAGHADLKKSADSMYTNTKWQLKLNGHDRFSERPSSYFTRQQVHDYHTGRPVDLAGGSGVGGEHDTIYVYSFALQV